MPGGVPRSRHTDRAELRRITKERVGLAAFTPATDEDVKAAQSIALRLFLGFTLPALGPAFLTFCGTHPLGNRHRLPGAMRAETA
jgi:hypothetical protein